MKANKRNCCAWDATTLNRHLQCLAHHYPKVRSQAYKVWSRYLQYHVSSTKRLTKEWKKKIIVLGMKQPYTDISDA